MEGIVQRLSHEDVTDLAGKLRPDDSFDLDSARNRLR